jgi:quercetin dioxygenase-like cupin family protein
MNGIPTSRALMTIACLVMSPVPLAAQTGALPSGAIQVPDGTGTWIEAPSSLPPGTRMMLLEGSPASDGFFTMRVMVPAGARLQPHWHPGDERVTILSGLVRVGFGDRYDESTMTTFGPGSFYLNPARSHHYVWVVEDTEMQLTGIGPWEIHLLEPGLGASGSCPSGSPGGVKDRVALTEAEPAAPYLAGEHHRPVLLIASGEDRREQ